MFFGDGAVQAGHFSESVNLAALWELPVILVCENNGFAEFTPRSAHTSIELVSDVVSVYGFRRQTVDGSDVPALWAAFAEILGHRPQGRGPMLLECLTHRRRGHYEGDAEAYRDQLAEEEWRRRDPVARLQADAIAAGWLDEAAVAAMAEEAADEVEVAVAFARASPFPEPELMEELVYAKAGGEE